MAKDYRLTAQSPTSNQRRPEYARGEDWIRDLLRRGLVAHIGTRWDEQPFVTPSNYLFDETGHRLIFHSNVQGRLRANLERHEQATAEVSELGRFLPSNVALEFGLQYRCVMVFGIVRLIAEPGEQRRMLHALISKYFPGMEAGRDYRPVSENELKRTAVYGLQIESWSGKENWKQHAEQSNDWPALDARWLSSPPEPRRRPDQANAASFRVSRKAEQEYGDGRQ